MNVRRGYTLALTMDVYHVKFVRIPILKVRIWFSMSEAAQQVKCVDLNSELCNSTIHNLDHYAMHCLL